MGMAGRPAGKIGTCFFLGALGALAGMSPEGNATRRRLACYEMCDGGFLGEAVSLLFGGAMGKFNIREKTRKDPLATGVYFEAPWNYKGGKDGVQ